jgi:hypothetical protein
MRFEGDATPPPGVRPLQRPNYRLTALTQQVVQLARPLLPSPRMLIGIEAEAAGELWLSWWGQDFRQVASIVAIPPGFCPVDSDEGRLQAAAVDLLAYLGGRWPVPPRRLGAITDGTGLAFAPDHPSLGEPGWLLRQAGGTGGLIAIIPFDSAGPCALLNAGGTAAIH